MALTTFAELSTTVLSWIERTGDTAASDKIADCVVLLEARLNNMPDFRLSEMEEDDTLTITSGSANLPADFLGVKRVRSNASSPRTFAYATPDWYSEAYPDSGTNEGNDFYTIVGTTLRSQSSATLELIYYKKIPPLTGAANWLLTRAPNIYLFGTLLELATALQHDKRDDYGALFTSAVNTLITSQTFARGGSMARRSSGPSP